MLRGRSCPGMPMHRAVRCTTVPLQRCGSALNGALDRASPQIPPGAASVRRPRPGQASATEQSRGPSARCTPRLFGSAGARVGVTAGDAGRRPHRRCHLRSRNPTIGLQRQDHPRGPRREVRAPRPGTGKATLHPGPTQSAHAARRHLPRRWVATSPATWSEAHHWIPGPQVARPTSTTPPCSAATTTAPTTRHTEATDCPRRRAVQPAQIGHCPR